MFREWDSPEAVFQILKRLSRGQPCDITGIDDYAMLDERGGIQWPYPAEAARGPPRRSAGSSRTAGSTTPTAGRASSSRRPRPLPEPPNADYPLLLLTGRGTASQWHTQTRTGKSAVLRKLYPQKAYVEINPDDAGRLGIAPDESVVVESQAWADAGAGVRHADACSRGRSSCRCTTRRPTG